MNTKSQCKPITGILISISLIASSFSVFAETDYQTSVLFSPSPRILTAEAKGRIMIYDGLDNKTVELAMTEQFHRIENMMFVRTRYIQEDGAYEVDDEGCD